MAKIKIKLVKGTVCTNEKHRRTIQALGLHKIGQVVEKEDTPALRGMIRQVSYLVSVEEA